MAEEAVRVVVRVRPMIGREQLRGAGKNRSRCAVALEAESAKVTVSSALYESDPEARKTAKSVSCQYDAVFGPESSQADVYEGTVQESVGAVMRGINCSVFAYGQTGTGKTFTIFGTEQEGRRSRGKLSTPAEAEETQGVIPRAVRALFDSLQEAQAADEQEDEGDAPAPETEEDVTKRIVASTVYCSYLQIYNEQLYDLLQDQKRQFPLRIRQSKAGPNYVQGLAEIRVTCLGDVYQVLRRGARNRAIRSTEYNEASSRSHAILQLRVETEEVAGGGSDSRVFRSAKLNFVDLAGSEKWDTQVEMSQKREKELMKINNSLSSLGNVVQALGEKDRRHIPYRDSKLTHLLQDSLGGNTRTTIICTLSPAADCLEESVSTLKFADRAKRVMVSVKVNEVVDDSVLLGHAQAEIARLKRLLRQKTAHESKSNQDVLRTVRVLRQENEALKDTIACMRMEIEDMRQQTPAGSEPSSAIRSARSEATPEPASSIEPVDESGAASSAATAPSNQETRPSSAGHEARTHMRPKTPPRRAAAPAAAAADAAATAAGDDDAESQGSSELEDHLLFGPDSACSSPKAGPESSTAAPGHAPEDASMLVLPRGRSDGPTPSDIVAALKDELQSGENNFGVWDKDQEAVLEKVEQQCFDELSYELEQLQSLKRERENLEEAMRLLKKGRARKAGRRPRRGPQRALHRSPLLNASVEGSAARASSSKARARKAKKKAHLQRAAASRLEDATRLSFSAQDAGQALRLYQCRVDSWYEVDVLSYDKKSGMHRVRYREDGTLQWHQMEGRRYELMEPAEDKVEPSGLDGIKALLRVARGEHESGGRDRDRATKLAVEAEEYQGGGLGTLWRTSPRKEAANTVGGAEGHLLVKKRSGQPGEHQPDSEILERLEEEGLRYGA